MTKSENQDAQVKSSRKYQKINKEERRLVLKLLLQDKLSLQEVANRLQLKYCTVRTIQKAYEKEGRIGKKETRKKKLKVENILKIQIINPLTFQLSEPIVSSEVSQIYIDKQPSKEDQTNLMQEQRSLLQQHCQKLFSTLTQQYQKAAESQNPFYYTTIQNLFLASQLIFKQLLEVKQQIHVKQEYEPVSPTPTQYPLQIQQHIYQPPYGMMLPRVNS
ncbi:unnamed protein product [Paramecium primaurelia]|uniref:Insertion element IS150 protein InsJ-like helix-turn-helix domain-containing protein n=1 Tax=Paramecium primaurelia TaxID=5886 RepID=A0A8S1NAF3_PARPR|nr:unnamed protein product [Paramecium primaurelia]